MATMNVSLPDKMKQWVEDQVQTGRYGNASDYVRDLVRRDQERAAKKAEFERLVQEGIDSGVSPLTPEEIFDRVRRKAGIDKPDAA
ncbi:type II toxin-antitoxin system ParD family antitoxin [Devosia ginsengisoli]|uniref:Type II toxin-antitoxin system ParD family antitoxin n=1 Tax=Devosia ginsengisoli TaxID=400770 RepID=A0A5B8LVE5_9HYPH|nr:type II toxin-antitoxin system ParD family antitoxin [Devosia ginsengisoli]QDZ11402.1 type II toxin-antitoxin system ParD family antitoxin [Devosia ginsengisoli]